jgi:transposase
MYNDILGRLGDAVRRIHPEKWKTNSLLLLHNNAPAHRSVSVKDFFAKNNVITVQHPPYCPRLAAVDL